MFEMNLLIILPMLQELTMISTKELNNEKIVSYHTEIDLIKISCYLIFLDRERECLYGLIHLKKSIVIN